MKTLEELQEELEALEYDRDSFEVDESEYEEGYREMLDGCCEGVFGFSPSTILEECDIMQYECGLSDYVYSLEITYESEYPEEYARIEELEELIEELESVI